MHSNSAKPYRGCSMEGPIATWYARNAAKDAVEYRRAALRIAGALDEDADVLDVATGPGHLAIELAKLGAQLGELGPSRVAGVDISRTFVKIAEENARAAGVGVRFQLGDAQALPFADESFDAVVCRAAFKNFAEPVKALDEMARVLRPGGFALVMDLNRDTPTREIDDYVDKKPMGAISRSMTRFIFKHMLMKHAYTPSDFTRMAATSRFEDCEIRSTGIGIDVWLRKPGRATRIRVERDFSPLLFV
jgi:ubiquinone/menaquinone biosynthesis C-methylase UbiE